MTRHCARVFAFLAYSALGLVPALAAEGEVARAISATLTHTNPQAIDGIAIDGAFLRERYLARKPLWLEEDGPGARVRSILETLSDAGADGLAPARYGVDAIARRIDARDAVALAELDLLLSAAVDRFARDIRYGHGQPEAGTAERVAGADERAFLFTSIWAAANPGAELRRLAPDDERYRRLRAALGHYRKIAAAGGWPTIGPGPTLRRGDSGLRVERLRDRLRASGDLPRLMVEEPRFNDAVEDAVRSFQRRHGLADDGIVGGRTRAALDTPVAERLRQLAVNLDRRRRLARTLGERYVFVNLADATTKVVEGDRTILDMRVVVGRTYRKTPVFSSTITHIEINPAWHVPRSIAVADLLPKILAERGFLAANNFQVLEPSPTRLTVIDPALVPWSQMSAARFPYVLRQAPGPDNALGHWKFNIPNPHSIYLHDTPARELFRHPSRAFSSGCIRLEQPAALAEILLAGSEDWPQERINAALASGRTQRITLAQPVPVHLSYVTAWVNKDQSVHFRDDVYGRDAPLASALGLADG